jgi:nucleoside-diphosphate-sugar epimerase
MRVFVTGATGVLGRSVVRLLNECGHQVRGLSRSPRNAALLRELRAKAVDADLLDPDTLQKAMQDCDAVLHLATKIPPSSKLRSKSAWTDSLTTKPVPHTMKVTTLDAEAAGRRLAAHGGRGVSLRMAAFYGPDSVQSREQLRLARRGWTTVFGAESAYHSSIWIEDAAHAVIAALLRAPSGVYDVADDEPLQNAEMVAELAKAVSRRTLRHVPAAILRWSVGQEMMDLLRRSQRISNRRFKEVADWAPKVCSARVGWALIAKSPGH